MPMMRERVLPRVRCWCAAAACQQPSSTRTVRRRRSAGIRRLDHQRPRGRWHRRAVVSRRRRHHRRSHHRDRPARRPRREDAHRRRQPRRRAGLHRHARPVGVQRPGRSRAPPARSRRASPPRSPAKASSIAPLNDALAEGAQAAVRPLQGRARLPHARRVLRAARDARRPAINVGTFVGAGGVRGYVVGDGQRAATADELEQMKTLVAQAMEQGALGVSTSLQYVPGRFASTDEIVELAKVARAVRRHLHLAPAFGIGPDHRRRSTRCSRWPSAPAFPRRCGTSRPPTSANWGRMPEILKHFEAARARGLDVTANMYPYDRASNGLDACLPLWVREGGTRADAGSG